MSLFISGDITLSSGQESFFKIDCDFLTNSDIETLAQMMHKVLGGRYGGVEGVPSGGLRLAKALDALARKPGPLLIVDDVWTTGGSWNKWRGNRSASGAVIFNRSWEKLPYGVVALFNLNSLIAS